MRKNSKFEKIVDMLLKAKNEDQQTGVKINVYGNKGVGKTRVVQEVTEYLRYRFKYQNGIFKIDLSKINCFESVKEIIDFSE